jgi:hypothetical protein
MTNEVVLMKKKHIRRTGPSTVLDDRICDHEV